jgi:hypothetical protein
MGLFFMMTVIALVVLNIAFSLITSTYDAIDLFNVKTDGHILSIKNADGFTYRPSDSNSNNNKNLTLEKYQQIDFCCVPNMLVTMLRTDIQP